MTLSGDCWLQFAVGVLMLESALRGLVLLLCVVSQAR
jgi:hypothetical protein